MISRILQPTKNLFNNTIIIKSKFLSVYNNVKSQNCRLIHLGNIRFLKEIKISETKNEIVVEAFSIPSDRKDNLVPIPENEKAKHEFCKTCPLCRLNLRRLKFTDILILKQFAESNGQVMPQPMTGLCFRSYRKIKRLIKQAQYARLLPRPPEFEVNGPWDNLNTYFEFPRRARDQPMKVINKEFWK